MTTDTTDEPDPIAAHQPYPKSIAFCLLLFTIGRIKISLSIVCLSTLFAALLCGDEVVLKDGTRMLGTILIESPQKLVLKHTDGTITIRKEEVASIARSEEGRALPRARKKTSSRDGAEPGIYAAPVQLGASFWPPQYGRTYPDLTLYDHRGRVVKLSSLRGKVILIEPIGMSCQACQAYSGAHRLGSYRNIRPQSGLESIEEYFESYSRGLSLSDNRIVFVQLILFDIKLQAPSNEAVRDWAQHFRLNRSRNTYVLAGTKEMIGPENFQMIPGFQLVDKQFVLRSDSTGHQPRNNLWTELLPMVRRLVNE